MEKEYCRDCKREMDEFIDGLTFKPGYHCPICGCWDIIERIKKKYNPIPPVKQQIIERQEEKLGVLYRNHNVKP